MKVALKIIVFGCLIALQSACQNPSDNINFDKNAPAFRLDNYQGKYQIRRHWIKFQSPDAQINVSVFVHFPVLSDSLKWQTALPSETWQSKHFEAIKRKIGAKIANKVIKSELLLATHGQPTQSFPVMILGAGLGWLPTDYYQLIQRLVKNGVVVVTVATTPTSKSVQFPDGKLLEAKKSEADYDHLAKVLSFVTNEVFKQTQDEKSLFFQKIDTQKIIVGGHSIAGAAAIEAAEKNQNIKAIVNLDGDVTPELSQARPLQSVLYLTTQPIGVEGADFEKWAEEKNEKRRDTYFVGNASRASTAIRIKLPAMYHSDFLDVATLKDSIAANLRKNRFGTVPPTETYQTVAQAILAFIADDFHFGSQCKDFQHNFPQLFVSYQ
jgi:predicted dienelactone hydrolase